MSRYTVSQVARRTGLSVRTLHHYESKGLLQPAARSAAGYRLYGERELARLQHIVSLRALGFPLDGIGRCLAADAPTLANALVQQVEQLRRQVQEQQSLLRRLEQVAARASRGETIDADTLLNSIEATTIMEKHFTPEQMRAIEARGAALGAERIREVEQAWPDVIAGMQAALELDKDPASAEVQALARRWRALVREFTGGDAGIHQAAGLMFRKEPEAMRKATGIDPALMAYACKAIAMLGD